MEWFEYFRNQTIALRTEASKMMHSRSPWGIHVVLENDQRISIVGDIQNPTQLVDGTTSEVLLDAQRRRISKSEYADQYDRCVRLESEDGAGQNDKAEFYGGQQDTPRSIQQIMVSL